MDWLRDFPWVTDENLVDGWNCADTAELQSGDIVFIWVLPRRGIRGGIRAVGQIVSPSSAFPLNDRKKGYFLKSNEKQSPDSLSILAIRYHRLCLGAPISKQQLEAIPGGKQVVLNASQPLYRISDAAGKTIIRMMRDGSGSGDSVFCRA